MCGKLARDTGDFSPLNLNDNPRSSVCPDSASATWSTANSAQNPYKWICSDDDEVKDPFTDEELRLRESVGQWFPLPPENSRNEPVTRYWAFYTFCDKVIARVWGLPVFLLYGNNFLGMRRQSRAISSRSNRRSIRLNHFLRFCLPDGMTFKRPNLKVIEASYCLDVTCLLRDAR